MTDSVAQLPLTGVDQVNKSTSKQPFCPKSFYFEGKAPDAQTPLGVLKFMPTVGWVTCRLDRLPKSCKTEEPVSALQAQRLWDGRVCESIRVCEERTLLQTRERLAP